MNEKHRYFRCGKQIYWLCSDGSWWKDTGISGLFGKNLFVSDWERVGQCDVPLIARKIAVNNKITVFNKLFCKECKEVKRVDVK